MRTIEVVDYDPASKTVYFVADGAYVQGEGWTSDFYRMPLDHSGPRETLPLCSGWL